MKRKYVYAATTMFVLNIYHVQETQGVTLPRQKNNLNTRPEFFDLPFETELDGKDHPCYRKDGICDGKPMDCFYHFRVEWYQSMSKACYDCPFNVTDCERKDCVMANGASRPITVVNRKMPGPSIEVCKGDTIIVNVTNDLLAAGTTIHWHGMHQKDTPFMDGVPFVTQCPVQPESTFTYKFKAVQAGTFFWHSHIGLQRGDGVSGALIIRQQNNPDYFKYLAFPTNYQFQSVPARIPLWRSHFRPQRRVGISGDFITKQENRRYDVNHHQLNNLGYLDKSEHVIQISDWSDRMSLNVYTDHYHSAGSMSPTSLLINGRGRFQVTDGNRTTMTMAPRFNVTRNYSYRFRLINAEFSNCPVEFSVDDHDITIIASDGYNLQPITVKSFVSYAGERFDFIINADQKIGNYWIRVRGLMNCANLAAVRQVGVLHYEGAKDEEPSEEVTWEPRRYNNMELNTENRGEEQNVTKTISQLRAKLFEVPEDDTLKEVPDDKFYVSYDMYKKNNDLFNKAPYYSHDQVSKFNISYSVRSPQLNHISMKLPNSPLLVSRPSSTSFCNHTNEVPNICKTGFCRCPHVLAVKLNSVVEVIIIDEGNEVNANHPFHLHGHSFRVLGQRRMRANTTNPYTSAEEVKEFDAAGKMHRNLINPPVKDTVTVPDGGYTIIRFKANNPGYWLFHCHIEFHAEVGMALVFKVGEHEDMKRVPPGFPKCGDYSGR